MHFGYELLQLFEYKTYAYSNVLTLYIDLRLYTWNERHREIVHGYKGSVFIYSPVLF